MLAATLPIPGVAVDQQPQDLLQIEQQPWSVYTGKVTKQEVVRILAALMEERSYQAAVDCGLAGDQLVALLYLYPRTPGLAYELFCDWGQLSDPIVEQVEIEEQVQFDLSTSGSPSRPVRKIISASWQDDCCNAQGDIVKLPPPTIAGDQLESSQAVHATALVRYLSERHTVVLNAPRREDALDQQWASVMVATYPGGLKLHELVMPPGLAAFAADPDAVCGASWTGSVIESVEDPYPPAPRGADLVTEVAYCKQATLREYTQERS